MLVLSYSGLLKLADVGQIVADIFSIYRSKHDSHWNSKIPKLGCQTTIKENNASCFFLAPPTKKPCSFHQRCQGFTCHNKWRFILFIICWNTVLINVWWINIQVALFHAVSAYVVDTLEVPCVYRQQSHWRIVLFKNYFDGKFEKNCFTLV
jgi:hypothetical protein